MKQLTWEEFYHKYDDWPERTAASNVKYLTSIGPAQEVSTILLELVDYPKAVTRLLEMAIDGRLALLFTDLIELYDYCDEELLARAVELCELDDRDSESLADVLCTIEKGSLFDAILDKARSCGVSFRANDLAELEYALDITVSEEMMEESKLEEASAEDILSTICNLEKHSEKANHLLREAVEKKTTFDAWELSQLPEYVDAALIKEAMKNASVENLDAETVLGLMEDYCDDKEMLQTIIAKAYRAKKQAKLGDLIWLDGECDTGYFIRMVELSLMDDVDAFVDVLCNYSWNQKAVEILSDKILREKILFSGEQLANLDGVFDEETTTKIVLQSAENFVHKDVDALAGFVPDALIVEICNKYQLKLPDSVIDESALEEELEAIEYEEKMFRRGVAARGFFAGLFNLDPITLQPGQNRWERRKRARGCSGDCANCPPHYGYRYGRWYYGRCHQHGCELGGNRRDGAYD